MRTCTTQGENKGRKQQRARVPLRQPSATAPTRRVVLKTYHLTGNHHKTCLKHSNFLIRKLCPIVTNMEHHGNSKGTGNRRRNKIRQNELRQGSKHGNYNILALSCLSLFSSLSLFSALSCLSSLSIFTALSLCERVMFDQTAKLQPSVQSGTGGSPDSRHRQWGL